MLFDFLRNLLQGPLFLHQERHAACPAIPHTGFTDSLAIPALSGYHQGFPGLLRALDTMQPEYLIIDIAAAEMGVISQHFGRLAAPAHYLDH